MFGFILLSSDEDSVDVTVEADVVAFILAPQDVTAVYLPSVVTGEFIEAVPSVELVTEPVISVELVLDAAATVVGGI